MAYKKTITAIFMPSADNAPICYRVNCPTDDANYPNKPNLKFPIKPMKNLIRFLLLITLATNALAENRTLQRVTDKPKGGMMAQDLTGLLKNTQPLNVQLNQSRYTQGEKLVITVDVQQTGYLNIIEINAKDEATVIFPNQYDPNNQVNAGKFTLPTAQMNFDLTAGEPFGHSTILAFLTTDAVNLYNNGFSQQNQAAQTQQLFKTLSLTDVTGMSRAFNLTQKQKAVFAGKIDTQVCATAADC